VRALALVALCSCIAISRVEMERVARLEIQLDRPHVVDEAHWKKVFKGIRCHDEPKKWYGGHPAVLVMDDGSRLSITGLADTGHFIRISDVQWCEVSDAAWSQLWTSK
jgi:hypothetical protein